MSSFISTNKKIIRSFKDLEVYQESYKASVIIARQILSKLPEHEKYDLFSQLSRSSKAIPRLIAEGHAKKHQRLAFQKYLDDSIGEANETIVSLEHVRDIYQLEVKLCEQLIIAYDRICRQLFNLARAWDKMKNRKNIPNTMPNNQTIYSAQ